jgi:hypothetical protein
VVAASLVEAGGREEVVGEIAEAVGEDMDGCVHGDLTRLGRTAFRVRAYARLPPRPNRCWERAYQELARPQASSLAAAVAMPVRPRSALRPAATPSR